MYCKKDKPEDYWKTNYHRRQNNFNTGFYSRPWEPYKAVGGDLILDSFDLVASSLPGGIDKKVGIYREVWIKWLVEYFLKTFSDIAIKIIYFNEVRQCLRIFQIEQICWWIMSTVLTSEPPWLSTFVLRLS